jgi:p190RhoGAP, pG1 and pG2 domains
MCIMCGDGFDVELPLSPLLNHQFSYMSLSPDGIVSVSLDTYFDESKHKVEVTISSYHGASQLKDCLFHGYLLVYWAKRKASLAALRCVLLKWTSPLLTLAIVDYPSLLIGFGCHLNIENPVGELTVEMLMRLTAINKLNSG